MKRRDGRSLRIHLGTEGVVCTSHIDATRLILTVSQCEGNVVQVANIETVQLFGCVAVCMLTALRLWTYAWESPQIGHSMEHTSNIITLHNNHK